MPAQTYITSLSIEECRSRLTDPKYSPPGFFTFNPFTPPPKGTIFVKLRGDRFRLFATGPRYILNSFVPFFYGSLEALPNGTRIHGRFRMHPFTRIFMAIWFGFLGVFTLLVITSLLFGDRQPQQPIHILFEGPVIMALFGTALVRFGWWFARGQRQSIRDFIRNDLLAQPQTQS